jgi:protein tyrosine phosphatase (PTP) superfamily phosphohydrolase (DUF442 family)
MQFSNRLPICLFIVGLPAFAGSAPGIGNFDQVDQRVYRGAQPTDEGFQYLAKLGVKTIIDLREADGRAAAEQRAVTVAGMKYVNVPMTGLTPPSDAEMMKILTLMQDASAGPVFVHCKRGADRTGAVIAAYHITVHKWDNSRALKDAKSHGMGTFQFPRQNYIKAFRPTDAMVKLAEVGAQGTASGETANAAAVAAPAGAAVKNQ